MSKTTREGLQDPQGMPIGAVRPGLDQGFGEVLRTLKHYPFGFIVRYTLGRIRQSLGAGFWTLIFIVKCWVHGLTHGKNLEVYGSVFIRSPGGGIVIGDHVQLISSSWRCTASSLNHRVHLRTFWPSARIILEDGVLLNGTSITCRSTSIRLGEQTIVGPNCVFMDSDFHLPWPPEARRAYATTEHDHDIVVGRNVWIGANCIVLKGVTIGDNAVIAAGSVVVRNIPGNVLAGGNPARVIKRYGDSDKP